MSTRKPVSIGVIGLSHSHVRWIFDSEKRGDIEIVAIVESDKALVKDCAAQFGFDSNIVYDSMTEMVKEVLPDGLTAFGSIYEHLAIVEFAAPRGIHVMVEKPLAVNLKHANRMAELARKHCIHLLTNYETTWYASTNFVKHTIENREIGTIRKVLVQDGNSGPVKRGCRNEFLQWLTEPKSNGGGAIMDFGCYGINLMTWLMDGAKPTSVTAITQNLQPESYNKVDDEAVIILTYPKAQAIIQGSWNWPIPRKDLEVYGTQGVVKAKNAVDVELHESEQQPIKRQSLPTLSAPFDDPFAFFASVIRGETLSEENDLSGINNNLTVMAILDAALESASTGKRVPISC